MPKRPTCPRGQANAPRGAARPLLVTVLVLLTAVFGGAASFKPLPMPADALSTKVVLDGARIQHASPAVADLNGDGRQEIVVAGQDGMLYLLAYDGETWRVVYQHQVAHDLGAAGAPKAEPCVWAQSDIPSSPAVADLDGDGRSEIVLATGGDPAQHHNGGVLVYRPLSDASSWSLALLPGWPQPRLDKVGADGPDGCWDGFWSTPALGDLDGDGDLEVVVEGFDRHLHAWHHDASVVSGWPIYRYLDETDQVEGTDCLLRGGWSSPALGDIDGDALSEVVVGTDSPPWDCPGNWQNIDYAYATVWAINGDGSNVSGWPVTAQHIVQSSPALGDIDGDGQLEVVVGSGDDPTGAPLASGSNLVYAWNGDGSPLPGWPQNAAGDVRASPALGDLDGDGRLEIVVGCGSGHDPTCNKLYAWHGDGSPVAGFPVVPPNNSWSGDPAQAMPYPPVLADSDGDGAVEILLTHLGSFGIATVGPTGASENDPLFKTAYTLANSPLVGDLDGDGELEIVAAGANTSAGQGGAVYIWETVASAQADLPWPMFHHDARRTGVYPRPARLAFPAQVLLVHQQGSAGPATVSVLLINGGDTPFHWGVDGSLPPLQVLPSTGLVEKRATLHFQVDADALGPGWHSLGTITVTGQAGDQPVSGSPTTSQVRIYIGDPSRIYFPTILGTHRSLVE